MITRKVLFAFFITALCGISCIAASSSLAIVVKASGGSANAITMNEIKDIYKGTKLFWGKTKIKPLDQKDGLDIKNVFLEKVLGINLKNYSTYWIKRVFQGEGVPPAVKNSSKEVLEAVAAEPGTIGYVWADEAKGADGIKVVLTVNVK